MTRWAKEVDHLLELSVVASFTRVGYTLRRRLAQWDPPTLPPATVVVVTGATSGIGRAGALDLARRGAFVIGVGRSHNRVDELGEEIRRLHPRGEGRALQCDVSDLDDVSRLADSLNDGPPPTVLLHNAGAISPSLTASAQGIESTFAAQVVGPHLLTQRVARGWNPVSNGRVVVMTSGGMYTQAFDLPSLLRPPEPYSGVSTYARVKRAQVVWVEALHSLKGLTSAAVHPGWTATAGLRDSLPRFSRLMTPLLRTAPEGAADLVWLTGCPELLEHPGSLWLDREVRPTHRLARTRTESARDHATLLSYLSEVTSPYLDH